MLTQKMNTVLELLRKLPPREQLKVISLALPEIEDNLGKQNHIRKSLRGLWKGVSITPEDIAEVRKSMTENFPRSDF